MLFGQGQEDRGHREKFQATITHCIMGSLKIQKLRKRLIRKRLLGILQREGHYPREKMLPEYRAWLTVNNVFNSRYNTSVV